MKYFTLKELTKTSTGFPNIPDEEQTGNLECLVERLLDPVREQMARPVYVSSGFRCPYVNELVGGVPNSQHLTGEAADIYCDDNQLLFDTLRDHFDFDQLINEKPVNGIPRWVHVSFKRNGKNRRQVIGECRTKEDETRLDLDPASYPADTARPLPPELQFGQLAKVLYDEEHKTLSIETAGKNRITLNDDGAGILLEDQYSNRIIMNASGITIESAKDLSFKAKNNITIDAGVNLEEKAKSNLTMKGLKIEAIAQTSLMLKGTAQAELSASGQTVVKGALVKIN